MIRIASVLLLIALAMLINVVVSPDGASAILFSFIGMPLVGLSMLLTLLTLHPVQALLEGLRGGASDSDD
jgi:hypothetical protein